MSRPDRLFSWTPFRVARRDTGLSVDWCHLDTRRMVEPFFSETIVQAMREPFNLAFQQKTSIDVLAELPPGVPAAGFIFHMSRCGSTLISQALAAFESNIVVSEAPPIRTVLRAATDEPVDQDRAALWLRGLVNAYAQQRFSYEARLFVKFAPADVLDIVRIRQAFPTVPWIFVTRDPAEILASHSRLGSVDLGRGYIPASRLGLDEDAVWRMDKVAFKAHTLARFAQAALAAHASGNGLILDYAELPEALWTKMPAHFGLGIDAGAAQFMHGLSQRHAKYPGRTYSNAHDPNRMGAEAFRAVAEPIAGPVMAELAALRGPA